LLDGLRVALAGSSSLGRIVRRHVGIEDERGEPCDAAGKLLRPCLVLFVAEELGADLEGALPAAVALELVHNFSLVHDDIQDRDRTRRGRPTLWTICGEAEAINAGDYLYAAAFREAARCGTAAVSCLAEATIDMVEGQSLDLSYEGRFVSIDEYSAMADRKTGALLRCAMELGGLVSGADDDVVRSLRELGMNLGRAFQIRDDALGIWGDSVMVGKPQGSDIRRRKKSFPVVSTHSRAGVGEREELDRIYSGRSVGEVDVAWVVGVMGRLGAPAAADAAVREYLDAARRTLDRIPYSPGGRAEMDDLIDYLAGRLK
jgi:geranylgeranyl diphosphate synthase type I